VITLSLTETRAIPLCEVGGFISLNLSTPARRRHHKYPRAPKVNPQDLMYKPMLAVDCGPVENLVFPLVASPKLDGVRAIKSRDSLLSRSLKPIPNAQVQTIYYGIPENLDGELLAGNPCATDVYRKTVSMVMSQDVKTDGLTYWLFDIQEARPWEERHAHLCIIAADLKARGARVELVPQVTVNSLDELLELEAQWVGQGYEGAILRKPGSPYKHGRSTVKEGYLLKLKRFVDGEAVVIGVTELMHNGNEATVNELGRTARSHSKAGMVPTGTMGTLIVRDMKTGVEFEIGTGFTAQERAEMWSRQPLGLLAKYKHFLVGAKDKPRHPVFIGWRDRRDT
jgi:DNA ligase-1